jgi:hypothetical protein
VASVQRNPASPTVQPVRALPTLPPRN